MASREGTLKDLAGVLFTENAGQIRIDEYVLT